MDTDSNFLSVFIGVHPWLKKSGGRREKRLDNHLRLAQSRNCETRLTAKPMAYLAAVAHFMKFPRILILGAFSCALTLEVFGQGFINLNFENTTITPVVFPGGTRYTATVPGWMWTPGGNFVNGDPNSVGYNEFALDSPAVNLQGTNSPFAPTIQGKYSILLQGGTVVGGLATGNTNGASIYQSGQIPLTAASMIYWGDELQVAFNGQPLSLYAISNAPNYTIWGADISAYAGQTGQLSFTTPWQSTALLDNIQFLSSPVPEPSISSLFCIGVLFLFWRKKQPDTETGCKL